MDQACQPAIVILGFLSMLLISKKNKWGFVLGLASQPFWFWTTARNAQWGILTNSVVYTFIFMNGIYVWFKSPPEKEPKE